MKEETFNEDYIKGIKFLLEKSREEGINIRKVQWVPHVSKMLSKHNVCYSFWYNVWSQKKLDRIPLCDTWYDALFDLDKCLFSWTSTYEGHSYWSSMLSEVLGTHVSEISSYKSRGSSMRWLCD